MTIVVNTGESSNLSPLFGCPPVGKQVVHSPLMAHPLESLRASFVHNCTIAHHYERDYLIRFDNSVDPKTGRLRHDYYVRDVLCKAEDGWKSASSVIKEWWPAFDAQWVAARCASSSKNPLYKGLNEEQIRSLWSKTSDMGHHNHACMEKFLLREDDEMAFGAPKGFYEFLKSRPTWRVHRVEWIVFDEEYKMMGTIDASFTCVETGKKIMVDWKNYGGDLDKSYGKKGCHPITRGMPATKITKTASQINVYNYMTAKNYDFDADELYMVNFPPSAPDTFQCIPLPKWDLGPKLALQAAPKPVPLIAAVPDPPKRLTQRITKSPLTTKQVWMGRAYVKYGYVLPNSSWWSEDDGCKGKYTENDLIEYERLLLTDATRLHRVANELAGFADGQPKTIFCWCKEPQERCHAEILAKYADAFVSGMRVPPPLPQ